MDDETAPLPIRIVVTDDLERSRVTVFFRLLLAIPHLVVVGLWGVAAVAVSIILWLAIVIEGKAPRSLQSFVVSYLRYSVQVSAYVNLAAGPRLEELNAGVRCTAPWMTRAARCTSSDVTGGSDIARW